MKTLVYCDTRTEIGKHIIEKSIWETPEQDFFCCDPINVEFVTDDLHDQDLKKLRFGLCPRLPDYLLKSYIHFAELDEILSRKDCGLIIDLSRLNHPEGTRGRVQNFAELDFANLLGIIPHPEIICLYKTTGIYPTIHDLSERRK
ncbi:MAG: hypothetical protein WC533_01895 [Candidatus Pacearchaeota archaeon]